MTLEFFSEDISFELRETSQIYSTISSIAKEESVNISHINYIFCSDEYLLKINQEYLNHDYFTDIITFDLSEGPDEIEADLFISVDRVKDNAESRELSFDKELKRVMIHGVLHLVGYGDKTSSEQEIMTKKEDTYLSL